MKAPTNADLLDEIRRLRSENERLKRQQASGQASRDVIQEIACALRDIAFDFQHKAEYFDQLKVKAYALVPDNLPTIESLSGILSKGRERVYAALGTVDAVDPVDGVGTE